MSGNEDSDQARRHCACGCGADITAMSEQALFAAGHRQRSAQRRARVEARRNRELLAALRRAQPELVRALETELSPEEHRPPVKSLTSERRTRSEGKRKDTEYGVFAVDGAGYWLKGHVQAKSPLQAVRLAIRSGLGEGAGELVAIPVTRLQRHDARTGKKLDGGRELPEEEGGIATAA